MGCDERWLHSYSKRSADSGYDCRGVVCGVSGVTGSTIWLEGSGLLGSNQCPTTVYGQSRYWLSNIRHMFDILSASVGHPLPILEDFQNSQAKDSQKKSSEERYAWTLQVRNKMLIIHFKTNNCIQKNDKEKKHKYILLTQRIYICL